LDSRHFDISTSLCLKLRLGKHFDMLRSTKF